MSANFMTVSQLLMGGWRRGAGKHAASVWQFDLFGVTGLRAVFCKEPLDRNNIAGFEGVAVPTISGERVRRAAFALPVLHGITRVLYVQIDPDMWVGPFKFGDAAGEAYGLFLIELRGEGMVRGQGQGSGQNDQAGGQKSEVHRKLLADSIG